ncbi:putative autophagy-related protein 14 [Elsinoe fawcettii]|nr:putative autophagy-related protein 14 [Elsinoe fawcettii]
MECNICAKRLGCKRQAHCPSCVRASLYAPRLEQINALLDREKLHKRVQTVLKPPSQLGSSDLSSASQIVDLTEASRKLEVERHRSHIGAVEARLESVREQQRHLKAQIAEARKDNAARKREQDKDRSRIAAARKKLQDEWVSQSETAASECKRLQRRLAKVQEHTVEGRQKLCMETAFLAGLNLKHRRRRDGLLSEDRYMIAGISIPDLRELNTIHPDIVNASLSQIVRLVVTTAHYLAIRLPAELHPPHADQPNPTVYSLSSSYNRLRDGKTRHLFISKPLPLLAKEDPVIYNNFVEGMVLLAYNIAWLCRCQGLLHISTWEGLCSIGKNLYDLYFGEHHDLKPNADEASQPRLLFGEFSHASAQADLNGAKANGIMQKWDLPSLARIQDKLKSHLQTEMSGAEWEMLDEKEWEEERDDERAVLVGGARWSLHAGGASRMGVSYMTTAMTEDGDRNGDADRPAERAKERLPQAEGAKGWMKVKSRNGEV